MIFFSKKCVTENECEKINEFRIITFDKLKISNDNMDCIKNGSHNLKCLLTSF